MDHGVLPRPGRLQLFAPCVGKANRTFACLGEERADRFEQRLDLPAEAAADAGYDDSDVGQWQSEELGDPFAYEERRLGGGVDDDAAVLEASDDAMWLDRGLVLPWGVERVLDDEVCSRKRILDVATLEDGLPDEVRRARGLGFECALVLARVVVNRSGVGRERMLEVDSFQRFQLEHDRVCCCSRLRGRLGGDRCDRFARVADFAYGKDRLILDDEAGHGDRYVVGGEDGMNAGEQACGAGVDAHDARSRQRRAEELAVQHVRLGVIEAKHEASTNLGLSVEPLDASLCRRAHGRTYSARRLSTALTMPV